MKKIASILKKTLLSVAAAGAFLFQPLVSQAATPYQYCFIGDSRFVGMEQSVDTEEDIIWVARNSANQGWYWENRDDIASLDRDTVIVYELGVNDFNIDGCLEALYDLDSLGFRHIYFTSIAPVDEGKEAEYGYSVTNSRIEAFNNAVRSNLPASVASMDSYEYLSSMGIETMDGVHYTAPTYQVWLSNILGSL